MATKLASQHVCSNWRPGKSFLLGCCAIYALLRCIWYWLCRTLNCCEDSFKWDRVCPAVYSDCLPLSAACEAISVSLVSCLFAYAALAWTDLWDMWLLSWDQVDRPLHTKKANICNSCRLHLNIWSWHRLSQWWPFSAARRHASHNTLNSMSLSRSRGRYHQSTASTKPPRRSLAVTGESFQRSKFVQQTNV